MPLIVRQAQAQDIEAVSSILIEAASWLEERGTPLWCANELAPEQIQPLVKEGLFFLAESDGEAVGTLRYQLEDPLFWPDVPSGESAYVHRLAVRRRAAGGAVSSVLLSWAVNHTGSIGRKYLRLDCDATRPKLRAVYERFGFRHHSNRQVGPYYVARYEYDVSVGPLLSDNFFIRQAAPSDESFLREMLYLSVYVPAGSTPFPPDIVRTPEIAKYVDGWGRTGDLGVIVVDSLCHVPIGAAWVRLFKVNEKGYGYV
jgi:GNAT superfamily N-acetyltransferase